jgi:hypothetical protein
MENNIDFYNEENKVSGSFFKFDNIGDEVKGTLIDVSEKDDSFKPGQKQKIYEIKNFEDGEILLVGGRPVIDPQMKNIRKGQIIAIKFEATKPAKKAGFNPVKLIQVYAPKNAEGTGPLMDEEWLAYNHDDNSSSEPSVSANPATPQTGSLNDGNFHEAEDGEITIEKVDFNTNKEATPVQETTTDPNKVAIDEIKALAISKLKVTEDMAFTKVMELTGLAIIPQNFVAIKNKLNEIA